MHIQKLQADLQNQVKDVSNEVRHQVEMLKAQAQSQKSESGPSVQVQGRFDDSEIKGMLAKVDQKLNKKKKEE